MGRDYTAAMWRVALGCAKMLLRTTPRVWPMIWRGIASNEPKPHQVLPNYLNLAPNTIWDNPGSRKRRKRVGRGPGSGKG